MTKKKLQLEDQRLIDDFNIKYKAIIATLHRAMQFKMDDYLVLYISGADPLAKETAWRLQKNSYGAPVKYKVVYQTEEGISFVKKVNKKGEPLGRIYSCAGVETDDYRHMSQNFKFELDPDFADAILLQDEYDPAHLHRSKKDIWKAVTAHNKACKIPSHDMKNIAEFFKSVNIGDMIWTSNISFFLVQDKKIMAAKDFNAKAAYKDQTRIKGFFVPVLTVKDKKGKIKDISPDFFHYKALYKDRPRTYKELNI